MHKWHSSASGTDELVIARLWKSSCVPAKSGSTNDTTVRDTYTRAVELPAGVALEFLTTRSEHAMGATMEELATIVVV